MMVDPPTRPTGAARTSRVYYDEQGRHRTAPVDVPVDDYGRITSVRFRCGKCDTVGWVANATAQKGTPVCKACGRRMKELPLRAAGLPWAAMRTSVEAQAWALWVLAGVAAAGAELHKSRVPLVAVAGAMIPVVAALTLAVRVNLLARARKANHLDDARRRVIDSRATVAGMCAAVGMMWLVLATALGVDPHTFGGRVALTLLVAVWVWPAATWWRWLRQLRTVRVALAAEPLPDLEPVDEVPIDPTEAETRRIWASVVAVRKDERGKAGKLVDTWLEDWHKVEGGWGATVVGPTGAYTSEAYLDAVGAIASAFSMKRKMITVIPDADDENQALVLAQRTSTIRDDVMWPGPNSIQLPIAPIATYADGTQAWYEIYRPDWGTPHVLTCGTTGAGKSGLLNLLLGIDRWASYEDEHGIRHGMVASFLVDSQQGQSFAPFLDQLAAPVACTLEEAKILVRALLAEMTRRNRYLAREAKRWHARRKKWLAGRGWWDPTIDGPIITLTIDEAHEFLADREFCALVTSGGRKWRKCGAQLRLGTQNGTLADLGGSMALRSMVSGGFVAIFRTADSLTGPLAFNGRMPVDPRSIPEIPGTCFIKSALAPKPMMARVYHAEDWYDWVYDMDDQSIGYPVTLPQVTLDAFGPEYAAWVAHADDPDAEPYTPTKAISATVEAPTVCVDAVRAALDAEPIDMTTLDAKIRQAGLAFSVRTIRDALARLRKLGEVLSEGGKHQLLRELTDEDLLAEVETLSAV